MEPMGGPKGWVSEGAFFLMDFQLPELGAIDTLFLKLASPFMVSEEVKVIETFANCEDAREISRRTL